MFNVTQYRVYNLLKIKCTLINPKVTELNCARLCLPYTLTPLLPFQTSCGSNSQRANQCPEEYATCKISAGLCQKVTKAASCSQAQCCEAQVALGKGSAACRGSRVFLSSTLSSSTQLKEGTKVPPAQNRGHVLTPPRYRDGVEGRGSGEMWCGNNLSSGQPSAEWETKS